MSHVELPNGVPEHPTIIVLYWRPVEPGYFGVLPDLSGLRSEH